MEINYIKIPQESGLKAEVIEVTRKGPGLWDSRVLNKYKVTHTTCECPQKSNVTCVHRAVMGGVFRGPEISDLEAIKVISEMRKALSTHTEIILPIGNTQFKVKPINKVELLLEHEHTGFELWSYYGRALVRLVFSNKDNFDLILDRFNKNPELDLGTGKILEF